jgi:rod shape-determining protein MreD
MGAVVLLLLATFAAALPDHAPRTLGIASHPPDLFAALAVFLALRAPGYAAVPWAIALGASKDALSLDPLGSHAFVLGTIAFLHSRPGRTIPVTGVVRALALLGGVLLAHLLYVVRMVPVAREGPTLASIGAGFPTALWTVLLTWPLFSVLERTRALDGLVGRRRDAAA